MTKQKSGCDCCKTNTLDKCEKYGHDFIYHEVNGIIDQRLCRKCNLNEKLPEKNWNNEHCGNKLCENCHPENYSKVKPEGVGERIKIINILGDKFNWYTEDNHLILTKKGGKYELPKIRIEDITDLLLQEKAKWKEKTEKEICILRDDESRFCNCGKNRCGYNEAIREILTLIDKL